MSLHDPVGLAALIEAQADITEKAQEVLEHVGTIQTHKGFDIGVNKVLAVRPGWSPARNPSDYVFIVELIT